MSVYVHVVSLRGAYIVCVMQARDTLPVQLFVEILNHYLYYYEQGLPNITTSVLQVQRCLYLPSVLSVV